MFDYHIGLTCEGRHAAHRVVRALWKHKLITRLMRPVIRSDNDSYLGLRSRFSLTIDIRSCNIKRNSAIIW